MLKEFREFIMRGNVLDLAVAVIIGAAFGKVITSAVSDVIMPPIGLLLGGVDFSNLFINLSGGAVASLDEARKAGAPVIAYGVFLNAVIDFLIVAAGDLPGGPRSQPAAAAARAAGGRADDQGMPALPVVDPDQGDTLRPLHLTARRVGARAAGT